MRTSWALLITGLLLTPAAWSLTLEEGRQQGRVGETFSGYLAAVRDDAETQALVARINDGRREHYQRLADQNHLSRDEVARIAGEKLVKRAAAGEYVRGINGQWLRKGAD